MQLSQFISFIKHPRYWPSLLGLLGLKLISYLPLSLLLRCGKPVGQLFMLAVPKRKKIAAHNIKRCFPKLSESARDELVERNVTAVGQGLVDTILAWFCPDKKIAHLVTFKGLEYIEQAIKDKRGVIIIGAHFTSIDLPGRFVGKKMPFSVVYRKLNNPVFNSVMVENRQKYSEHAIKRNDIKGMIRCLKNKGLLWYAPDQDYGRKPSIFVPFFGIQTATITATSRLAKITNALVIPGMQIRQPDGKLLVEFSPPLNDFPSDDITADTARINSVIETVIRQYPEQYLWQHRRFKTRPANEPDFYGDIKR